MSKLDYLDRRAFPRVPVHLEVRYEDGRDLAASYVESLSFGGVYIRTPSPLPVGTEIVMDIVIADPEVPPSIRVIGQVVWGHLEGTSGGMGIRFTEEPPPLLRDLLRKLLTP
ncbi:MAG: PilZ domain-containing protein [Pseudomonadota bacterium]